MEVVGAAVSREGAVNTFGHPCHFLWKKDDRGHYFVHIKSLKMKGVGGGGQYQQSLHETIVVSAIITLVTSIKFHTIQRLLYLPRNK